MAAFHSKFGGLWIDDTDPAQVESRLTAISDLGMRRTVNKFIRDGFTIIPGAVSHKRIDAYLEEYEAGAAMPGKFQLEVPLEGGRQAFSREGSLKLGSKVLDTGMLLPSGQELCFAPKISDFLETIFGEKSLAFQTLHFEVGSTQAIHQDTAYVVVDRQPLKLIASWLALEDVQPGSGELVYFVGGHRIEEHSYAHGASKHWDVERDGQQPHDAHLRYLHAEAERRGLEVGRFLPKKGDVLFWHADLPHGGGKVTKPGVTRRSLVTHYCPLSLDPYYMQFVPREWQTKTKVRGGNAFISLYFAPANFAAAA